MGAARISVVVDDDGAIQLPPTFGYDQGFRTGDAVRLRPIEVSDQPFDPSKRRLPSLHFDDEHLIVTLGLPSRLRVPAAWVERFGLGPGDRVVFELSEETRSASELQVAGDEWRRAHGIPEMTEDEIDEIVSDSSRDR